MRGVTYLELVAPSPLAQRDIDICTAFAPIENAWDHDDK